MSRGRHVDQPVRVGAEPHLPATMVRPGGSYRLCPCGFWHWYDRDCPVGESDALTREEFAEGFDRE